MIIKLESFLALLAKLLQLFNFLTLSNDQNRAKPCQRPFEQSLFLFTDEKEIPKSNEVSKRKDQNVIIWHHSVPFATAATTCTLQSEYKRFSVKSKKLPFEFGTGTKGRHKLCCTFLVSHWIEVKESALHTFALVFLISQSFAATN